MLKYVDTQVTFAEVPNEITLCINISNCICHCKNCHSAYLAEDIGEQLTTQALSKLIENNSGITCVSFMGGDIEPSYINSLAEYIKENYPTLKICWYSGKEELSKSININNFSYLKLGPYIEEYGPLNYRTTNQRFYKVVHTTMGTSKMYDITYKFWKNETED